MELSKDLITRARAKLFKEALFTRIWDETMLEHIDEARSSSIKTPCTLVQFELSSLLGSQAPFSSNQLI
ncbi:hypothetical protein J1N35_037431 [Gossypium stocksii]|uniref:Uncharacterized protein n=1 Tax=Gossypium stocksii TaxID=47602 RepID=A0A9D3UK05_9ROSI|nr:hypothetical protein J1N35_037431 [Gossypium stocksii]